MLRLYPTGRLFVTVVRSVEKEGIVVGDHRYLMTSTHK